MISSSLVLPKTVVVRIGFCIDSYISPVYIHIPNIYYSTWFDTEPGLQDVAITSFRPRSERKMSTHAVNVVNEGMLKRYVIGICGSIREPLIYRYKVNFVHYTFSTQ